ncbi:hypothetical protein ACPPVT_18265 [Angustibacter sp. McL0619]|uniref:hypothetical protein n=1 Tax=Angustibacter sp. McL0619 TaxID=3415676 RepID=UPI003CF4ED84
MAQDRHNRKATSVAVLTLLLLSGCAQTAVTAGSAGTTPSPEESAMDPPAPSSPSETTVPVCGQRFETRVPGDRMLTGRFPSTARADQGQLVGAVELTAGSAGVHAVIAPQADTFLTRDGVVVTMPAPQDLAGKRLLLSASEVEKLPALATLTPCGSDATSLPAGSYEIYVRVVLNDEDGTSRDVLGGPWPVELS